MKGHNPPRTSISEETSCKTNENALSHEAKKPLRRRVVSVYDLQFTTIVNSLTSSNLTLIIVCLLWNAIVFALR